MSKFKGIHLTRQGVGWWNDRFMKLSLLIGEAKRRKDLGLPPREKAVDMPTLDKDAIQKQVRSYLEKNPTIPFLF